MQIRKKELFKSNLFIKKKVIEYFSFINMRSKNTF